MGTHSKGIDTIINILHCWGNATYLKVVAKFYPVGASFYCVLRRDYGITTYLNLHSVFNLLQIYTENFNTTPFKHENPHNPKIAGIFIVLRYYKKRPILLKCIAA